MDKSKQRLRNKWDDKKGEQERVKKKNRSGRKPTRKLAVSEDTCICTVCTGVISFSTILY
jgi:hypothetical protein